MWPFYDQFVWSGHSQKWFWVRARFPSNPIATVELTSAVLLVSVFKDICPCVWSGYLHLFFAERCSSSESLLVKIHLLSTFTDASPVVKGLFIENIWKVTSSGPCRVSSLLYLSWSWMLLRLLWSINSLGHFSYSLLYLSAFHSLLSFYFQVSPSMIKYCR